MLNCGWIKYGFGKNLNDNYVPFNSKNHTNKEKSLYIDYTNNGYVTSMDPWQAGVLAVEKITREYPPPYVLMMSGGVDSQSMLHIWLKSGKPFVTKTYAYNCVYNSHDISNLLSVSNKFKIKFNFENIDALSFFENELYEYAFKYHCTSPQICLYIKMAEQVKEGTVIFSGNFLNEGGAFINYTILGLHRYQLLENSNIVPFFLVSTPELAYSIRSKSIENDIILGNTSNKSYKNKIQTLSDFNFPIIPQTNRFSGFEEIKNYYDIHYPLSGHLKAKYYRYDNNFSQRAFDIRLRFELEQFMPYSNNVVTLLI